MEHCYQDIEGFFHFEPLYRRVVAEAPDDAVFVEVGVWKGRSAAFLAVEIAKSGKRIRLHAVDAFTATHDGAGPVDAARYQEVKRRLKPLGVQVVRSQSADAADRFQDGSLDFVFIDADHSYDAVRRDIAAWLPKVKPGGLLAGDDYCYPGCEGVKQAVDGLLVGAVVPSAFVEGVSGWWEYRVPVQRPIPAPITTPTPTISVITGLHAPGNAYILETYESLLKQTLTDWEWCIVENNGGRVPDLIRGDSRVRVVSVGTVDPVIGRLKRRACAMATGAVVAELDADDLLLPNALEVVTHTLHRADFCFSDFAEFMDGTWAPHVYDAAYGWAHYPIDHEGHALLAMVSPDATPQNLRRVLYAPNHIRAWRAERYWAVGGHDPTLAVMDDHDLTLRFFLSGATIERIGACLYLYRRHAGSTVGLRNAEVQAAAERTYAQYAWALAEASGRVWVDRDTSCKNRMRPGEWLMLLCPKADWYNPAKIPLIAGDFHLSHLTDRGHEIQAALIRLGPGYTPMGEVSR